MAEEKMREYRVYGGARLLSKRMRWTSLRATVPWVGGRQEVIIASFPSTPTLSALLWFRIRQAENVKKISVVGCYYYQPPGSTGPPAVIDADEIAALERPAPGEYRILAIVAPFQRVRVYLYQEEGKDAVIDCDIVMFDSAL